MVSCAVNINSHVLMARLGDSYEECSIKTKEFHLFFPKDIFIDADHPEDYKENSFRRRYADDGYYGFVVDSSVYCITEGDLIMIVHKDNLAFM